MLLIGSFDVKISAFIDCVTGYREHRDVNQPDQSVYREEQDYQTAGPRYTRQPTHTQHAGNRYLALLINPHILLM